MAKRLDISLMYFQSQTPLLQETTSIIGTGVTSLMDSRSTRAIHKSFLYAVFWETASSYFPDSLWKSLILKSQEAERQEKDMSEGKI